MMVVDHLGYRLLAMTLLPLTATSLVHGSCDGGLHVWHVFLALDDVCITRCGLCVVFWLVQRNEIVTGGVVALFGCGCVMVLVVPGMSQVDAP